MLGLAAESLGARTRSFRNFTLGRSGHQLARVGAVTTMKRLMSKIDRSRAASAAAEPAAAPAEGSAAEPKADGGAGGAGETATTAQQMKDLLSSQPASASAYLMRSRALGALGQWDAAAADCSGALERGSALKAASKCCTPLALFPIGHGATQ